VNQALCPAHPELLTDLLTDGLADCQGWGQTGASGGHVPPVSRAVIW